MLDDLDGGMGTSILMFDQVTSLPTCVAIGVDRHPVGTCTVPRTGGTGVEQYKEYSRRGDRRHDDDLNIFHGH